MLMRQRKIEQESVLKPWPWSSREVEENKTCGSLWIIHDDNPKEGEQCYVRTETDFKSTLDRATDKKNNRGMRLSGRFSCRTMKI